MSQKTIPTRCSLTSIDVWRCAALIVKNSEYIDDNYKNFDINSFISLKNNQTVKNIKRYLVQKKQKLTKGTNTIYIPIYVFGHSLKSSYVYHGESPNAHKKSVPRRVETKQIKAYPNTGLLARLLFSEAAGDSHYAAGRDILRAIAWTVRNRVEGSTHPDSYFSVIYQKGRTGKPHFRGLPGGDNSKNWYDFPNAKGNWNVKAKNEVILIANEVLSGKVKDPTFGAEWFRFRKDNKVNSKVFIEKEIKSGKKHIRLVIDNKNPNNRGSWIFVSE